MSRTVFILGAGASKQAGGPLMAEFLDTAERIRRAESGNISSKQFDLVFKGRTALQAVHSKSNLDLDNIESVLAAFEMADLFKRPLGQLTVEEVRDLPIATRRLMVETIEKELDFPFKDRQVLPPPPYHDFVDLIQRIRKRDPGEVCLITFNYDLGLDYALHFNSVRPGYCLEPGDKSLPLLKLHGSFNWAKCTNKECGAIVPWYLHEFFSRNSWQPYAMGRGNAARLNLTQQFKQLSHCNKPCADDPVIVPPTWNKTQHHREIASVWQQAAHHLSQAENIFVIGYSLPETDQFFRYLFAIGTIGDSLIKRFWVYDPEQGGAVKKRYEQLLGQMSKKKFDYLSLPFANAIGHIADAADLA